ncbi:unnamed protein product [Periconia digitata]|uniref:Large ribosomal subunit protein uL23m n=1 Tax=Periconia digitata TaxID=1303443 RepID=A0A9W4XJJ4_9PLEO|nr:unnamed protein product [Periconia digitata]
MDASNKVAKKIVAFGNKQVFLPKFTIALVRTPLLSPYHARFKVPLNFSKYDLRDYLYHAYSVKTFNIRSFVKLSPVRDTRHEMRHWFREENEKYMTVEMETPFKWPKPPTNWEPWGMEEKNVEAKRNLGMYATMNPEVRRENTEKLRARARSLLEGKAWKEGKEIEKRTGKGVEKVVEKEEGAVKKTPLEVWQEKRTPTALGKWF